MLNQKDAFPIFQNQPNLAYFDSANTSQTPRVVIEAMNRYYDTYRANVGRGDYNLTDTATHAVAIARNQVADLINCDPDQLLFTSGTTDSLNRIATWCASYDTVIVTEAEHNANIIPWLVQGRTEDNGKLVVIPIDDTTGYIDVDYLETKLQELDGAVMMSFCATSNVSGITQPWEHIATICHKYGASVAVDFCQTVAHNKIDLSICPVEWACFSSHKMYGPTGVGALYTAFDLDDLTPRIYGGGAVEHVSFNTVEYSTGVTKHEPGTPNIASIIGFGVAAELIGYIGYADLHDQTVAVNVNLLSYGFDVLPNCKLYIHTDKHDFNRSVFSLIPTKCHAHDISVLLHGTGVAVRTGKVCAHPLVNRISPKRGIVRISVSPFNDVDDCRKLVSNLQSAFSKFS